MGNPVAVRELLFGLRLAKRLTVAWGLESQLNIEVRSPVPRYLENTMTERAKEIQTMKADNRYAPSRRRVLKVALTLGAAAPLLTTRLAFAQKIAKNTAHYQNHPNGKQDCRDCDFFVKPPSGSKIGSCQLVQGKIAPNGWCEFYKPEEDVEDKD
jgi:hypothetical protein